MTSNASVSTSQPIIQQNVVMRTSHVLAMDMFGSCNKKLLMIRPPPGLMVSTTTTLSTTGIVPKRTIPALQRASRVLIQFQAPLSPASVMKRNKWPLMTNILISKVTGEVSPPKGNLRKRNNNVLLKLKPPKRLPKLSRRDKRLKKKSKRRKRKQLKRREKQKKRLRKKLPRLKKKPQLLLPRLEDRKKKNLPEKPLKRPRRQKRKPEKNKKGLSKRKEKH